MTDQNPMCDGSGKTIKENTDIHCPSPVEYGLCPGCSACRPTPPTNDQMAREAEKSNKEKAEEIAKRSAYTLPEAGADEARVEFSFLIESIASALTTKDRQCKERVERVVRAVEALKDQRGRDVLVAERTGKEPTTRGPISQARVDGYRVATEDAIAAARRAAGEGN